MEFQVVTGNLLPFAVVGLPRAESGMESRRLPGKTAAALEASMGRKYILKPITDADGEKDRVAEIQLRALAVFRLRKRAHIDVLRAG